MNRDYMMDYAGERTAATSGESARVSFIRRTYLTLGLAIAAFVGIEAGLLHLIKTDADARAFFVSTFANKFAWLALIVLFIGGGFLAQYMARNTASKATQYAGLSLYVGIEVLFFLPILAYCMFSKNAAINDVPFQAGLLTVLVFGGLTAAVFISKKDFSFLGYGIWVASLLALGLVIIALITGLNLGVWFSVAMIGLAAACILYDTSNILHHYPTDAHVSAALELFASIAMLFYYIVRLLLAFAMGEE